MNKEIKILIQMCLKSKESYTSEELAEFIHLKFINGVYPFLRKLQEQKLINKDNRGVYSLDRRNRKVQNIEFIVELFKEESELLFTSHAKNILLKFWFKYFYSENY